MNTTTAEMTLKPYPNDAWYWALLDEYRDEQGRGLVEIDLDWMSRHRPDYLEEYTEGRIWQWSPKPPKNVDQMIQVLSAYRNPILPMTFLEFGTCWGTTTTSILKAFPKSRGIGLEMNPYRCDVTRFMLERCGVADRVSQRCCSIQDAEIEPESIDVVFMDTHHTEEDYDYILHVLNSGWLRPHWLFVGDDPEHTGTKIARERFIANHSDKYHIITRIDQNLWWFRA